MATLTRFRPALFKPPMTGQIAARGDGSDIFVVNKASKTAQNDPDDPNSIYLGDHADDANVIIVENPGFPYIDLAHCWSGAANPTTPPSVAGFGLWRPDPGADVTRIKRYTPADAVAASFDPYSHASMGGANDWVALRDRATGDHIQAFGTDPEIDKDATASDGKVRRLVWGVSYYCDGLRELIFPVTEAGDQTGPGVIIGRFSSV